MTPERRDELLSRLLDGNIPASELRELHEEAAGDPEFARRMAELLSVEPLLADALSGEDAEEWFVRRILNEARRPADTDAFARALVEKLSRRRRRRISEQRPGPWIAWLAAAGLLVTLAGWFVARQGAKEPVPAPAARGTAPSAPEEPPIPEPPRPPTPPPAPVPPPPEERPAPPPERPAPPATPRPPVPAPLVPEPPLPPGPGKPAPTPPTAAAVARVDRASGEVFAEGAQGLRRLEDGKDLLAGEILVTEGAGSEAALVFPDGTRIEAGPGSSLRPEGPKRIRLDRGTLAAAVPRQPPGRAMSFGTPHAEVAVLGTRFSLAVTENATRLEVSEGKVRLTRKLDGKSVDVGAGHCAVAAAGVELAANLLPTDEILLLPKEGRIAGGEWRLVEDERAPGGKALEAAPHINRGFPARRKPNILRQIPSFVLFTFRAEAGKDYHVWIRGWCMAKEDRVNHDSVALEPADASFARPCPWFGPAGQNAFIFDYYSAKEGYWWVGGSAGPGGRPPDPAQAVIRFHRPGTQAIRLYALESPMRVGAIWLSTTQKDRPDASQLGPAGR